MNYLFIQGNNWICRCNEGDEQSPIDLPFPSSKCCINLLIIGSKGID
jgi:hypothetical protein